MTPIPEVEAAILLLEMAVSFHLAGDRTEADRLIRVADLPILLDHYERAKHVADELHRLAPAGLAPKMRRPLANIHRVALHQRDGWRCRYCGSKVVDRDVGDRLRREYPDAVRWARNPPGRHSSVLISTAVYDLVVPPRRGGTTNLDNLVTSCWLCQAARSGRNFEDLGLHDPRSSAPLVDEWDGLRRLVDAPARPAAGVTDAVTTAPIATVVPAAGVGDAVAC
ncbi:MAG: hypothetical protein S0880_05880 [Actinomycetota bacterium]|nr:hypothetical protein [Actinomycetota bacterium]